METTLQMKKPPRKLIPLPMEMVVFCYEQGWSVGRIARACSMSHNNIRHHLKRQGIEIARNLPQTELPVAEIVVEYLRGMGKKALARKYECSPKTIRRHLKSCGLE